MISIPKKRGYVAGPMRGYPQMNFPAFDAAAKKGRELGFTIFNPAEMDREDGQAVTFLPQKRKNRLYARRDTGVLLNHLNAEAGDFIAMLPGWEKSIGATAEHALARWLELEILDAITFRPLGERPPLPPQFQGCGVNGDCSEGGSWGAADMEASIVRIADDMANRKEL